MHGRNCEHHSSTGHGLAPRAIAAQHGSGCSSIPAGRRAGLDRVRPAGAGMTAIIGLVVRRPVSAPLIR
jgi:hypothetical protein